VKGLLIDLRDQELRKLRALVHDEAAPSDELDQARREGNLEFQVNLVDLSERRLAAITSALVRQDESRFGICEGCKDDISLTRLQSVPFARYCFDCQRQMETASCRVRSRIVPSARPTNLFEPYQPEFEHIGQAADSSADINVPPTVPLTTLYERLISTSENNDGLADGKCSRLGVAEATATPGEDAVKTRKRTQNWSAIILAGGEGSRLADLSCRIAGKKTPKQFCQIIDDQSLIEQTRRRVELAIQKDRIFYALNRSHERYYIPLLSDVLPARLVVQPLNRGTTPAILYSLMRLGAVDPTAHVALFPCDHYVSDDSLLMRHVRVAFHAIDDRPELIVVLGITPSAPEPEYGWIEPASAFLGGGKMLFHVRRFIEKPSVEVARRMWAHGRCLWNTFILVGRLPNLLTMMIRARPELYDIFTELSGALGTKFESEAVEQMYRTIAPVDFCKSVLSTHAHNLSVLPVSGLYWNDLGNSSRVLSTIARSGLKPKWMA